MIQAKLKRNGKEVNPHSLGETISDNIQDIVEDVLDGLLSNMGVVNTHNGVTSSGAVASSGAGAGGLGFDEIDKSKRKKKGDDET